MLKTDFTLFKQNMEAIEKSRSHKLTIVITDDDNMEYLFRKSKQHAENYGRIRRLISLTEKKYKQYVRDQGK